MDEFQQQHRHYLSEMAIFRLEPASSSSHFGEVITFLSHVAVCYKDILKDFPAEISALLSEHYLTLDRELRKVMVRALILMRNRGLCEPVPLLKLCFLLFRCPDKELRQLLFKFIVSDVRSMNKNSLNHRVNRDLQNFLYSMLEDASTVAARKSLDVIIELYRRRVWMGARTVNAVAGVCLSKDSSLARAAVRFFLGIDHLIDADQEDEDDETRELVAHAKMLSERTGSVSKKTRARKRRKAREITKAKKIQQKMTAEDRRLDDVRWPAIDLLHDPQGFVDKLYKRVRTSHAQFEVLPPDELKPLIKTIANNFVSDRCSGEVIAVGLNTLREVAARVPLVLDEDDLEHIWLDMVDYRTYRGDKNVAVAARSALNFLREVRPELLKRKDRGKEGSMALSRGTAGAVTNRQYGEIHVADGVDGVELLEAHKRAQALDDAANQGTSYIGKEEDDNDEEGWEICSDSDSGAGSGGDGNWVTVQHSDSEDDNPNELSSEVSSAVLAAASGTVKRDQRDRLDAKKILTPRDFELLEKLKAERAQLGKRKRRAADHYTADVSLRTDNLARASVVDPTTLEGPHAIRKRGLEERLRTMREGQMGRDSNVPGRKAGMSNREKEKRTKNFMMISKKRSVLMKQKQSLRQVRAKVNRHRAHLKKNTKTITKIRSRRRQGR
eukprot:g4381.t1